MRNYTTQMDAARKGIATLEIETVAKKENMSCEALMKLVAEGKVAELESYRDKYYEIKTDSRYLKILLDIVNESTDKENILAKYQHRDSYILDDEIPF